MHSDPRVARVWPTPEEGHTYVRQELPGGEYLSTGQFPAALVDAKGTGRTFNNCSRVTTLFYDADLLTIYDAARRARGAVLERKAADRKKRLYHEKPALIEAFKKLLHDEFLPILENVIGLPPTLVVDSGWGYHLHYAVHPDVQEDKEALRQVAAAILAEANRLGLELARTMEPAIEVSALFDPTFDVGARLARLPGTTNTKAPGQPKPVVVVAASPTELGRDELSSLQDTYAAPGQLPLGAAPQDGLLPKPSRPKQSTTEEVDFRSMHLPDGRVWQQVVDALQPGERTKVICPFGGTTVGSGFFAKEGDGRTRYYSAPRSTTWWNTHQEVRRTGLAQLVRGPAKPGKEGKILNTAANLMTMLEDDDAFSYWYDEFAQAEMAGTRPVVDTDWLKVRMHMETAYGWAWSVPRELVWSALELVSRNHGRNPVVDWLRTLRWDGCPRMDRWLVETCGVEDTDLYRAYSRKWLIGLVARALKPGCKLDTMLVLSGPQGAGKSTLFRAWVDIPGLDGLFSDTRFNLRDKDAYLQLYSAWVYEDAELAGSSTADQETKKAFLSSATDRIRPPFGRKVRSYKRHTVVVGTTNETEILRDKTGARRYWVVELDEGAKVNVEWVKRWQTQLFAEAVVAYEAGEPWWLEGADVQAQSLHNADYAWEDWYSECARTVAEGNGRGWANRFTVAQFARSIDARINPQSRGISLAAALRRAGFTKKRSGGATWYYMKGKQTHKNSGLAELARINEVRPDGMPGVWAVAD